MWSVMKVLFIFEGDNAVQITASKVDKISFSTDRVQSKGKLK